MTKHEAFKHYCKRRGPGRIFQSFDQRSGICGLVKNEQDGSVYVEAEGEDFHLDIFLSWLSEGLPAARVESVETAHAILQNHSGFEITG